MTFLPCVKERNIACIIAQNDLLQLWEHFSNDTKNWNETIIVFLECPVQFGIATQLTQFMGLF